MYISAHTAQAQYNNEMCMNYTYPPQLTLDDTYMTLVRNQKGCWLDNYCLLFSEQNTRGTHLGNPTVKENYPNVELYRDYTAFLYYFPSDFFSLNKSGTLLRLILLSSPFLSIYSNTNSTSIIMYTIYHNIKIYFRQDSIDKLRKKRQPILFF